jgi:hypothetical protein
MPTYVCGATTGRGVRFARYRASHQTLSVTVPTEIAGKCGTKGLR